MPQKTQGTGLSVASADGSPKTITGITAASPPVVTSAAHGFTNGQVVYLDSIVGMVELNQRAFVVANSATNTFELKGDDGTGYTAYGSGGTATPKTMLAIGEIKAIPTMFDGEASVLDGTHLKSSAKVKFLGLQDFGGGSLNVFMPNPNDAGQTRMRAIKKKQLAEAFLLTAPSGQSCAFMAFCQSFAIQGIAPDGLLEATVALLISTEPGFLA